jgi:hypothetical protein
MIVEKSRQISMVFYFLEGAILQVAADVLLLDEGRMMFFI